MTQPGGRCGESWDAAARDGWGLRVTNVEGGRKVASVENGLGEVGGGPAGG
jgi:hypothetical protein